MAHPIVYIDHSTVRDGKLGELKAAMRRLADFVEANVPQLISYAFYLDREQGQMTVVAVHPDSASLEYHMEAGAAEFRKFSPLIELRGIEVYGEVSDRVLERLYAKADALGKASVATHTFQAGFARELTHRPG